MGARRPDSLRIEIPAAVGLRFLLVSRDGALRADLPGEDAMFEGPQTPEVMNELFGIEVEPHDLVSAILGDAPASMSAEWRFDAGRPSRVTLLGKDGARLTLNLDDSVVEPPGERAFAFGPPRQTRLSLQEMAGRLGLRR